MTLITSSHLSAQHNHPDVPTTSWPTWRLTLTPHSPLATRSHFLTGRAQTPNSGNIKLADGHLQRACGEFGAGTLGRTFSSWSHCHLLEA
ncbi:hypothetical protein P8C59_008413 [Phyllachora maydis]|uniref:Uncharacterized protein n=1 Tax=Phyllachora maydis TaxID=1825666 RepID=A0AAD9MEJ9_9PEZI|nr:hypothetical protein P8C59_008413 [Phyllachora maydis]